MHIPLSLFKGGPFWAPAWIPVFNQNDSFKEDDLKI